MPYLLQKSFSHPNCLSDLYLCLGLVLSLISYTYHILWSSTRTPQDVTLFSLPNFLFPCLSGVLVMDCMVRFSGLNFLSLLNHSLLEPLVTKSFLFSVNFLKSGVYIPMVPIKILTGVSIFSQGSHVLQSTSTSFLLAIITSRGQLRSLLSPALTLSDAQL